MNIFNQEGIKFLTENVKDNSVDLVLTDPPYITSRKTGMDQLYNNIEKNNCSRSEQEWNEWVSKKYKIYTEKQKENFLKYGSIYGKKYAVRTQYGDWDDTFSLQQLEMFIEQFYKKLRVGGTCIIFFDLWKIGILKELMEKYKFKQIRMIEWVKTNPQPLNSKVNYLTNSREVALLGIKKSKPTFNSSYDNGLYYYPIQTVQRFHPTQKNTDLFIEIIKKHTNPNDLVVDTFLGSGTTAVACAQIQRKFIGCEMNKDYYAKIISRLNKTK